MKALSVKQPWASYLVCGVKTIECRSWPTKYRGDLLICSSKGDAIIDFEDLDEGVILPGGMALGVVNLFDCDRMKKEYLDAAMTPEEWDNEVLKGFAWHIKPVFEIIPVPIKGKLGIYNIDIQFEKLPERFKDHAVYLDFLKYGKFRHEDWENK